MASLAPGANMFCKAYKAYLIDINLFSLLGIGTQLVINLSLTAQKLGISLK
jgi:hypothetical protein